MKPFIGVRIVDGIIVCGWKTCAILSIEWFIAAGFVRAAVGCMYGGIVAGPMPAIGLIPAAPPAVVLVMLGTVAFATLAAFGIEFAVAGKGIIPRVLEAVGAVDALSCGNGTGDENTIAKRRGASPACVGGSREPVSATIKMPHPAWPCWMNAALRLCSSIVVSIW